MELCLDSTPYDQQAAALGVTGLLLMEGAARAVTDWVLHYLEGSPVRWVRPVKDALYADTLERTVPKKSGLPAVLIMAGPGNNGGDGLACARQLHLAGIAVSIFCVDATHYQGDALVQYQALRAYPDIPYVDASKLDQPLETLEAFLQKSSLVLDALLGNGLNRPITGLAAEIIDSLNRWTKGITLSIDLPSGIQGATGQVMGSAVRADATLCLEPPKVGAFLAKAYSGQVWTAAIGMPPSVIQQSPSPYRLLTPADCPFPKRDKGQQKYGHGHVLIIAGSRNMPGAAVMACTAALRSGVGMVTLAAPASVFQQTLALPNEVLRFPLPETDSGQLADCGPLLDQLSRYDAVLIGPGLGRGVESLLIDLLPVLNDLPAVLDADALTPNVLNAVKGRRNLIITPHTGEAARIANIPRMELESDRLAAVQRLKTLYPQSTLVLKSDCTVVADAAMDQVWINPLGNDGMATGGSGDVLSGLLAGFLAQGQAANQAARSGVWFHSMAGDVAAQKTGPCSLLPQDILATLPNVLRLT